MKGIRLPILLLMVCGMISCGIAERTVKRPTVEQYSHKPKFHHSKPALSASDTNLAPHKSGASTFPPPAYAVSKYKEVQVSLEQAYRDWNDTPYLWGGETRAGVDCSGFMQLLFSQYFGVKIPRTTQRQIYTGRFVHRDDLKSGDLVFFDTGRNELHVGVIVKGDEFLHSSSSQGVTMSSLQNPYWNSHYLTARRVLEF